MELLGGQLIVAEPKGSEHATAVDMADDALRAVLPPGWIVRVQNPIALDDESAPEPDIAVVRGIRAAYRHAHPTRPALVIEVAESSLAFDRWRRAAIAGSLKFPATAGTLAPWPGRRIQPRCAVATPYGRFRRSS